jgi:hypothetical protein
VVVGETRRDPSALLPTRGPAQRNDLAWVSERGWEKAHAGFNEVR